MCTFNKLRTQAGGCASWTNTDTGRCWLLLFCCYWCWLLRILLLLLMLTLDLCWCVSYEAQSDLQSRPKSSWLIQLGSKRSLKKCDYCKFWQFLLHNKAHGERPGGPVATLCLAKSGRWQAVGNPHCTIHQPAIHGSRAGQGKTQSDRQPLGNVQCAVFACQQKEGWIYWQKMQRWEKLSWKQTAQELRNNKSFYCNKSLNCRNCLQFSVKSKWSVISVISVSRVKISRWNV